MYRMRRFLIGFIFCIMEFVMLHGSVIYSHASEPTGQQTEQEEESTYYLHENSNVDTIHALTKGALPCIGEARILVFYVDFKNGAENWPYTVEAVESMFFSEKGKTDASIAYSEEDSLRSVYYRSSYGKVDITGDVYEYETKYDTSYYADIPMVLDEVIEYYRDTINWNDYDGNNDGYIDGIYLIARNLHSFGGPNTVTGYLNTVGDKEICKACFLDSHDMFTVCHETCHMFGPADMYESVGVNPSGINTYCFMEEGYGDLPSPTKFVLGWLDNVKFVDKDTAGKYELKSYSKSGDVLIIYPNGDETNRNWIFVEYVTPEGNNPQAEEGLRVWKTQMNLDEDYNINGAKEYCFGMPASPYEYLESVCPEGGFNYYMKTGEVLSPYTYPSTAYSDTFYMIGGAKFLKDLTFSGIEIKNNKMQNSTAEVAVNISGTPDYTKEVILESKNYMPDKSSAFLDEGGQYHIATIDSSMEAKTLGGAKLVSLDGTKSIPLNDRMAGNNRSVNLYIDKQYLTAENMKAYKLVIPTMTTYYGQSIQTPQMTDIIDLPMLPISYDEDGKVYDTGFQMSYESYLSCFKVSREKIVTIFWDDISHKLFWGEFDLKANSTAKYELEIPEQLVMNGQNENIIVWEDGGFYYVYMNGFICCYQNKAMNCYLDTATLQDTYTFCGGNQNSYFVKDGNKELYHLEKKGNQLSLEEVTFIRNHSYKSLIPTICEQYGEVKDVYCLKENRYIINSSDVLYLVKENSVEEYNFKDQSTQYNLNMRTVEVVGDKIYVFNCGKELTRYEFDMDFNLIEKKVLLHNLGETVWGPFTMDVVFEDDLWVVSMETVSCANAVSYSSTFVITFDKNGSVINYYRYGDQTYRYVCKVVPIDRDTIACIKAFSFFYLTRPGEHFYSVWEPYDKEQHKRTCECGDTQYARHIWNVDDGSVCSICGMDEREEQVRAFVERMYTIVLNRPAEEQGLNDWTARLMAQELDGGTLVNMFVFSDEFIARNVNNEEYIKILYCAVLGREADADGLQMWKELLDGEWTRDQLKDGFVLSDEFKALCDSYGIIAVFPTPDVPDNPDVPDDPDDPDEPDATELVRDFVRRMYTVVLNRPAEEKGLNDWTNHLLNGIVNGAQVADGFIGSEEFANRNLSNEDYVKVLYRAFFNREADEGGFNVWMNELAKGVSRRDVMKGFVHSVEFSDLCAQYGIIRGEMQ